MGKSILHVLFHVLAVLCYQTAYAQISFPEEPVNTTVFQEGRASLRCVAVDARMRRASVSWRKGVDEPLSNRFHFDPASGTLSLPLVQCEDSGWYSCVASDGSETTERRAYLQVLCGTAPSLVRSLHPSYSLTNVQSLGTAAVVNCYFRGSPPPDVSWQKDGETLPSSPSTVGPYAIGGSLHLTSSLPGDSGSYCCVAKNRLGTAVECTAVNILEEVSPLWLSWWMLSLYCVVALVVLLSIPLCYRLAMEGCHRRKEELREVQSFASEGALGRRSAPAWQCEQAFHATPEDIRESSFQERRDTAVSINDETVEVKAAEEGGSSDGSLTSTEKGNTAAPPFGVEVVKAAPFFRPMMWYERWNQQECVQQDASPPRRKGSGQKQAHSPHCNKSHGKQKSTTDEGLPGSNASPKRKVPSQAAKAEKIRKSEGKVMRQWGSPHQHQMANFPPVDMKLQLVEVGEDEDEVATPNPLSASSGGHDTSLTSNAQSEDALLKHGSTNVALDRTSSPALPQVVQFSGNVAQDSILSSDPACTSLSLSPSSLGSLSPTESQIDLQTDRAFSFLEDYDLPSDLAEEDGWGQGVGEELRGMNRQKGAKKPFRT